MENNRTLSQLGDLRQFLKDLTSAGIARLSFPLNSNTFGSVFSLQVLININVTDGCRISTIGQSCSMIDKCVNRAPLIPLVYVNYNSRP